MRQLDPIEYPERERRILLEKIGQPDEMNRTEDSINPEGVENDICLVFYHEFQIVYNIKTEDYQLFQNNTEELEFRNKGRFQVRTDVVNKVQNEYLNSEDGE